MSKGPTAEELLDLARRETLNPGSVPSACDDCPEDCKKDVTVHYCFKKVELQAERGEDND